MQALSLELGVGETIKTCDISIDIDKAAKPDVIADMHYLPFRSNVFSLVKSIYVLEHLSDISKVFRECYRVLINSGVMDVVVPHALSVGAYGTLEHNYYFGNYHHLLDFLQYLSQIQQTTPYIYRTRVSA